MSDDTTASNAESKRDAETLDLLARNAVLRDRLEHLQADPQFPLMEHLARAEDEIAVLRAELDRAVAGRETQPVSTFDELEVAAAHLGYQLTPEPHPEHGMTIHADGRMARAQFVIENTAVDWTPEEGPSIGRMALDALTAAGFRLVLVHEDDETLTAEWEQARRAGVELAAKLIIRQRGVVIGTVRSIRIDEFAGSLVVDCAAIMQSDNQVRYWELQQEPDGTWSHGPSGEVGHPLSELLQSIALCYAPPADQETA